MPSLKVFKEIGPGFWQVRASHSTRRTSRGKSAEFPENKQKSPWNLSLHVIDDCCCNLFAALDSPIPGSLTHRVVRGHMPSCFRHKCQRRTLLCASTAETTPR